MALERGLMALEGLLTKVSHVERILMEQRSVGHEFVRCWMNLVAAEKNDTLLRRDLSVLIATFCQAREGLSRQKKYELLRFYMSVALLRFRRIEEAGEEMLRLHRLQMWEHEAFEEFQDWPWGEEIFSGKVLGITHEALRLWQVELMKDNETMEVVQIDDAWALSRKRRRGDEGHT